MFANFYKLTNDKLFKCGLTNFSASNSISIYAILDCRGRIDTSNSLYILGHGTQSLIR